MGVATESVAKLLARDLLIQLRDATGPNPEIDKRINRLFDMPHHHRPTGDLNDARRLVRRYYQWGMREYKDGRFGAYVEVSAPVAGFIWRDHACEPIALAMAALAGHIEEME